MLPSSVPAQRMLTLRGLAASAVIEPCGAGVTPAAYLPTLAGTAHAQSHLIGQVSYPDRVQLGKTAALELTLETDQGIYPQVVTQKPVSFNMPGDHSNIPKVDIFHDGILITSITEIMVTY